MMMMIVKILTYYFIFLTEKATLKDKRETGTGYSSRYDLLLLVLISVPIYLLIYALRL